MSTDKTSIQETFVDDPELIFATDSELAAVFSQFGAAIYFAQVLENGLFLLMGLAMKHDDVIFSSEALVRLRNRESERSIGELLHAIREMEYLTPVERQIIRKAGRSRNKLVHNYMVDHAMDLTTSEGKALLSSEIKKMIQDIRSADRIVVSLIDRYLADHGTTIDEIKEFWEQRYDEE